MTTIAFDGKTLAVDRGSWKNNFVWSVTRKLFGPFEISEPAADRLGMPRGATVVYAAAGTAAEAPLVATWLFSGGGMPDLNDKEMSRGIVVWVEGRSGGFLTSLLTLEPIDRYPIADGGGFEIALGAMLAGASAVRAVELTIERTGWAAGGVDSFTLPD